MKRSEMVDIIAEYLHHDMYQIGDDKYIHASKILQKMEDNGMLPPKRNEKINYIEVVESGYTPEWVLLRRWDKE